MALGGAFGGFNAQMGPSLFVERVIMVKWNDVNATKTNTSAFAVLCGLSGLIAGVFEILQGNVATEGFVISTIGPSSNAWQTYTLSEIMATYSAVSIIPNFLLTGVLALVVSVAIILWGIKYVGLRWWIPIFLLLSLVQLLVGGSFVMDLALITALVASRIGRPSKWLRRRFSLRTKTGIAASWPYALIAYSLVAMLLLTITVVGVFDDKILRWIEPAAGMMFLPLLWMIFAGRVHDHLEQ